jgi:hypothetical protein
VFGVATLLAGSALFGDISLTFEASGLGSLFSNFGGRASFVFPISLATVAGFIAVVLVLVKLSKKGAPKDSFRQRAFDSVLFGLFSMLISILLLFICSLTTSVHVDSASVVLSALGLRLALGSFVLFAGAYFISTATINALARKEKLRSSLLKSAGKKCYIYDTLAIAAPVVAIYMLLALIGGSIFVLANGQIGLWLSFVINLPISTLWLLSFGLSGSLALIDSTSTLHISGAWHVIIVLNLIITVFISLALARSRELKKVKFSIQDALISSGICAGLSLVAVVLFGGFSLSASLGGVLSMFSGSLPDNVTFGVSPLLAVFVFIWALATQLLSGYIAPILFRVSHVFVNIGESGVLEKLLRSNPATETNAAAGAVGIAGAVGAGVTGLASTTTIAGAVGIAGAAGVDGGASSATNTASGVGAVGAEGTVGAEGVNGSLDSEQSSAKTAGAAEAGGGGGGGQEPERKPLDPKTKKKVKIFAIVAGVAVVLIGGSFGTVAILNNTVFSPLTEASNYVDAIAEGDSTKANQLSELSETRAESVLSESEYLADEANRIQNVQVSLSEGESGDGESDDAEDGDATPQTESASSGGNVKAVDVKYTLGGQEYTKQIALEKQKGGIVNNWKVVKPLLDTLTVTCGSAQSSISPSYYSYNSDSTAQGNAPCNSAGNLEVNGKALDIGKDSSFTKQVYPGIYTIRIPEKSPFLTADELNVTSSAAIETVQTVKFEATELLENTAKKIVDTKLAECVKSKTFEVPEGCLYTAPKYYFSGKNYYDNSDYSNFSWSLKEKPTIVVGGLSASISQGEYEMKYHYNYGFGSGGDDSATHTFSQIARITIDGRKVSLYYNDDANSYYSDTAAKDVEIGELEVSEAEIEAALLKPKENAKADAEGSWEDRKILDYSLNMPKSWTVSKMETIGSKGTAYSEKQEITTKNGKKITVSLMWGVGVGGTCGAEACEYPVHKYAETKYKTGDGKSVYVITIESENKKHLYLSTKGEGTVTATEYDWLLQESEPTIDGKAPLLDVDSDIKEGDPDFDNAVKVLASFKKAN